MLYCIFLFHRFAISTCTGNIIVKHKLKYFKNGSNKHVVKVIVTDNGEPQLSTSRNIAIIVNDVNEPPTISYDNSSAFEIPENATIGQKVNLYAFYSL